MPVRRRSRAAAVLSSAVLAASLSGCGSEPPKSPPSGVDGLVIPTPSPDPDDFVAGITNEWLPFTPGSQWLYTSTSDEGTQTITVTVLEETRLVAGITATVVQDMVLDEKGRTLEETYDWYAQDRAGNVWYLGEDTTSWVDGQPDKSGSWEAGVDGAQAGIVMLAVPRVGDGYRQEFYEGEAEDQAEVLSLTEQVTTPLGDFLNVLQTADSTPLEPDVLEHKFYAKGTGLVREEDVSGGDEVVVLEAYSPA